MNGKYYNNRLEIMTTPFGMIDHFVYLSVTVAINSDTTNVINEQITSVNM